MSGSIAVSVGMSSQRSTELQLPSKPVRLCVAMSQQIPLSAHDGLAVASVRL